MMPMGPPAGAGRPVFPDMSKYVIDRAIQDRVRMPRPPMVNALTEVVSDGEPVSTPPDL
jgi:hypothetical protein